MENSRWTSIRPLGHKWSSQVYEHIKLDIDILDWLKDEGLRENIIYNLWTCLKITLNCFHKMVNVNLSCTSLQNIRSCVWSMFIRVIRGSMILGYSKTGLYLHTSLKAMEILFDSIGDMSGGTLRNFLILIDITKNIFRATLKIDYKYKKIKTKNEVIF